MPDLLIRDVDAQVLEKLQARAERNGRVVQSEIQNILRDAAENFENSDDPELPAK